MKEHVLVVEDDPSIRLGLVEVLRSEDYRVSECENGEAVWPLVERSRPDLILLDVMLPEKSGYDVCRELRARGAATPIIFLTAKGQEIDKVVGLKLGADDYVTKPFGVHELLARVEAVLRRSRGPKGASELPAQIEFGRVRVDTARLRGAKGDESFELSPRELSVLWVLFRESDKVVDRHQLMDEVWGQEYFGTTRTLDQVIVKLRQKIEADPGEPRHILTVHGAGYRFEKCPLRQGFGGQGPLG